MEYQDVIDVLRGIKTNYREFLYGLVCGIIVLGLLIFVFIDFLVFLVFANLILTAMILVVMPKTTFLSNDKTKEAKSGKKQALPCPECGSTRRHKKGCSRSKKKNETK